MSNGFFFIPLSLRAALQKAAPASPDALLESIVRNVITAADADKILSSYTPDPKDKPAAMDGDAHDYPNFWQHVDRAGRAHGLSRDTVVAAALKHHFDGAAARKNAADFLNPVVMVSLPHHHYTWVNAQAAALGVSRGDFICACIEDLLARPKPLAPMPEHAGHRVKLGFFLPPDLQAKMDAAAHLYGSAGSTGAARDELALLAVQQACRHAQAALDMERRRPRGVSRRFRL